VSTVTKMLRPKPSPRPKL